MYTDEYFMREALKEAQKAFDKDEVPIGAIVVWNNRILARAHNLTQTLNDVTAHAEMQAFTSAANTIGGKYLTDCTLYVTVEPCIMCAGAAYWTQISRVVYGASDSKRGFSILGIRDSFTTQNNGNIKVSLPFHPKTVVEHGILASECGSLLSLFFKKKRG